LRNMSWEQRWFLCRSWYAEKIGGNT
jgi:hypothetical protein